MKQNEKQKQPATMDPVLSALLEAIGANEQEVPEGFRTTREWMAMTGKSETTTKSMLYKGLKIGFLEKRLIRRVSNGKCSPVAFYGPAKVKST